MGSYISYISPQPEGYQVHHPEDHRDHHPEGRQVHSPEHHMEGGLKSSEGESKNIDYNDILDSSDADESSGDDA